MRAYCREHREQRARIRARKDPAWAKPPLRKCICCKAAPPVFRYARCEVCLAKLHHRRWQTHEFDEESACRCKLCMGYRRLFGMQAPT
jgi:hypothetical protein